MEAPKRRTSLTKKQLETDAGRDLLNICQSITADGRIADEEINAIHQWLEKNCHIDLPAAHFLTEVLSRTLENQTISDEERREIAKSIEAVLPPSERKHASLARKQTELEAQQLARDATEKSKQEAKQLKNLQRPLATADFMVAGTKHEDRSEIIDIEIRLESKVILKRDKSNRHSRFAIAVLTESGECIGHVPEDYAQQLAPILDQGAVQTASVKKILEYSSGPVPVIIARLYDPRADLRPTHHQQQRVTPSEAPQSRARPGLRIAAGILITLFVVAMIAANN